MSVKIDSPLDAFNYVKEKCTNEPEVVARAVGISVGVVAAMVLVAVILYRMRMKYLLQQSVKPKRQYRKRATA